MRAAIYARISPKPGDAEASVERQVKDSRVICERNGWEITAEHVDTRRSAWQRNRSRPGWDALLASIRRREVDVIVVYHPDRLMRQPWDFEELLHACGEHGVMLHGQASGRDLSNPDDVFILRIEVAHACRSSDDTSRRVKRALNAAAEAGRPHGGNRAYGTGPGEAEQVRRIADQFLAGSTINSIVNDLNGRRIPSAQGGRWSNQAVRGVLTSPRNAGLRVHHGKLTRGQWDPIFTVAERDAILRLLTNRQPRVYGDREYILRGFIRCSLCKTRMQGMFSAGKRAYRCPSPALGGCGKVKVVADPVEQLVDAWARRELADLTLQTVEVAPQDTADDDADVALLTELARMLGEGTFTMAEYLAARAPVEQRRKARLAERRRLPLAQIGGVGAEQILADWPDLPTATRRAVYFELLDAVMIDPVQHLSGPKFQPERVRPLRASGLEVPAEGSAPAAQPDAESARRGAARLATAQPAAH